jgi:2-keto-4-pentenoate hydratase/2-oxohepta-3-ene-1,7-dioic acid hydratase in catechol pathway
MNYYHKWTNRQPVDLPVGKVVCVGRNYADHAAELNNPVPTEPLLFMKPETAIVSLHEPVIIPTSKGEVHHEVEIAVLIGKTITKVNQKQAVDSIIGIGVALDLTLRDLQNKLKKQGHPWEKAKAFDGSCPLSCFEPTDSFNALNNIEIEFRIKNTVKQKGSSSQMLFDIVSLVEYITTCFTLKPGDVVLTGTPKGVGPLTPGDEIQIKLHHHPIIQTTIIDEPIKSITNL